MAATTEATKTTTVTLTNNPLLALLKNKQLTNSTFWKKIQALLIFIIGIAPFLSLIFPQYAQLLDQNMLKEILAAVTALVAALLTPATTGSIGIPVK